MIQLVFDVQFCLRYFSLAQKSGIHILSFKHPLKTNDTLILVRLPSDVVTITTVCYTNKQQNNINSNTVQL